MGQVNRKIRPKTTLHVGKEEICSVEREVRAARLLEAVHQRILVNPRTITSRVAAGSRATIRHKLKLCDGGASWGLTPASLTRVIAIVPPHRHSGSALKRLRCVR
jgi:hypothetical protein